MKKSFLSALTCLFICVIYAQDMNPLLEQAARQERDLKETEALQTYQSVLKLQPNNIIALCKSAELTGRIGSRIKNESQRSSYFATAKTYAETALKQKENFAEAYYVMAYTSMKQASVAKGKDRAAHLRDMKYYTDSSLLFNPEHAGALYLSGKWNIEIFNLNAPEKAAVKLLFGGMPKATLEAAIIDFEKARKANPWLLLNYLDLSKTYVQHHSTGEAIAVLQKMVKMPPRTGDDEALKAEGRKLLESLQ